MTSSMKDESAKRSSGLGVMPGDPISLGISRNRKCNRKCRGKCATGSVAVSVLVARLVHTAQQEEQEEQVKFDVHRAARLQLDPLVGGEDGAPHRDLVGQLLVRLLPPRLLPVDEEDVVVRLGYMGVAGWVRGCRL
eukprot:scaffold74577_cov41-Phaeocystis_antarctica.AAC.1